jgi:predicted alpha/beta superfamily hydrolase
LQLYNTLTIKSNGADMRKKVWGTSVRWAANLFFIGLLLGIRSVGLGQQSVGIGWVTDTIKSRALGQRTIYIATPEGYDEGTSRYPILVLLDANHHPMFQLWIAQSTYLADNSPGVPPVIAVGIPNGSDRIHDMLPPATGSSMRNFKTAGGAAAFADFVIDEVLPYVRARYRTLPSAILAGHSAAGLFAVDVAARRPGTFQGIIAMDPSLQFNDGTLVDTYADLLGRSRTRPRLFVASRGGEAVLPEACKRFAEILNASLGGTFSYRVYPDATHQLVPMSFDDGLQFVFDPVSPRHLATQRLDFAKVDSVALNDALRSSESTYATAARSLGLPEQLPEGILNDLGYELLEKYNKAALAISVFKRNVLAYPQSVNVYDSLADGFLAAADTASALAQLRTAVKVAHSTGARVPEETQKKLEALEAK